MKALAILIMLLPLPALAAEKPRRSSGRPPSQPHYHRQSSDPAWLATVVHSMGISVPRLSPGPGWA